MGMGRCDQPESPQLALAMAQYRSWQRSRVGILSVVQLQRLDASPLRLQHLLPHEHALCSESLPLQVLTLLAFQQTARMPHACTLVSGSSAHSRVNEYLDASDPWPPNALSSAY